MPVSPAELQTALQARISALTQSEVEIRDLHMLAGGASQELWSLDLDVAARETRGEYRLVLRRQLGGKIYRDALDLEREFRVMQIAYASDVPLPYPQAFLHDLLGRPAALMHRKEGETIGRRIVRDAAFENARKRLPAQMGEMLARIHCVDTNRFNMRLFLPHPPVEYSPARWEIKQLEHNLDEIGEPHPALELGIRWLHRNESPAPKNLVWLHGDYRIGNVVVNQDGLVSILDWEFSHLGDPYQDLSWPLLRDWRFGNDALQFGGIAQSDDFFAAYERASNTTLDPQRVHYWIVLNNVRWAVGMLNQARRHLSGEEPNLEFASLGRRCAEVELEVLALIEKS